MRQLMFAYFLADRYDYANPEWKQRVAKSGQYTRGEMNITLIHTLWNLYVIMAYHAIA